MCDIQCGKWNLSTDCTQNMYWCQVCLIQILNSTQSRMPSRVVVVISHPQERRDFRQRLDQSGGHIRPWTLEKQGLVFLLRSLITRQHKSFPQASTTPWPQMGVNGEDESSGQAAEADSKPHQQAPAPWVSAWDTDVCCFFSLSPSTAHRPSVHRQLVCRGDLLYVVVQYFS